MKAPARGFWSTTRGRKLLRELLQTTVVSLITWFAGPTPGVAQEKPAPQASQIVCVRYNCTAEISRCKNSAQSHRVSPRKQEPAVPNSNATRLPTS